METDWGRSRGALVSVSPVENPSARSSSMLANIRGVVIVHICSGW